MSTEPTGEQSEISTEGASTAKLEATDILVGTDGAATLAGYESGVGPVEKSADALRSDAEALSLQDVVQGAEAVDSNGGVVVRLEMVGGDTLVSLDTGGEHGAVAVVTLEGVTGATLQQLLNNDPIVI